MSTEINESTLCDSQWPGPRPGITRRQFLQASAVAAASILAPAAAAGAARDRRLLSVPFRYQRHTLTCEIAALRMAAEYFGQELAEEALLRLMPIDERQPLYEDGYVVWTDPNLAFPGNFRGWQLYRDGLKEHPERAERGQWGYGIHAPTIAEVAVRIGLAAELFDEPAAVYAAIDRRRVPIVIVPDGGRDQVPVWKWTTPQGKLVTVMNAEHSVVVRGYDGQTVWVHDPKGKVGSYSRGQFERAFGILRSGVAIMPGRRIKPRTFTPM